MIQPEFCCQPVQCIGCDSETDCGVWFPSKEYDHDIVVLCPQCIAALMFTSMKHPKAEKIIPNKRSVSP